jgi:hypothetical protein
MYSFVNHHVINFLNRDIGHSQVNAWVQKIAAAVIHALVRKDLLLV